MTQTQQQPQTQKPNEKSKKKETQKNLSKEQNLIEFVKEAKNTNELMPGIKDHINNLISQSTLADKYQFVFLYDQYSSITNYTSDKIYKVLDKQKLRDVFLFMVTSGGQIEPAYLISKCCKEYSKSKFVTVIPRQAKSAGTLLALGADQIHMGSMSQLGPIDPQINGLPVLGLSNAVEYLAMFCKKWPESSDMFAKYLSNQLDLRILGYFERVAESAVHYAIRLLGDKKLPDKITSEGVAKRLVYEYKDHNFVIDKIEAKQLLGEAVQCDTNEYKLGDQIYKFLEIIQLLVRIFHNKKVSLVGDVENGISFSNKVDN